MTLDFSKFRNSDEEDQFDIAIDENGQWYHQGSKFNRSELPKLFSTVLKYDEDHNEYWLVTPVERGRISVDDVPFIINQYQWDEENNSLILLTQFDHEIIPDQDNKIHCDPANKKPYVIVRDNLKARINRSVRNDLIEIALSQDGYKNGILVLKANGTDHVIAID